METINAIWNHSYGEDCIPNFSANMEKPRHRWYEFKEGFSSTLVERAIRETKIDSRSACFTVLDPFSGSGTSPLTALQSGCNAVGYEVNPCKQTKASTSMLIDTPEGSLDIAYETNAGSMFYEYVAENQKMIITANLNSSGLIQTLATKTKLDKFELISMLKWAKLSSVQNTHFELFEKSISIIEGRLEG